MMFSFIAFNKRGPWLWWRSSLLFSCIIIGFLLYLESENRYPSKGKITELVPASPSSNSSKLKVACDGPLRALACTLAVTNGQT